MPRVSSEENKEKKIPRKRVVRRVASKKSDSVADRITESFSKESVTRKAPTSISSVGQSAPAYKKPLIILGIFVFILSTAAGIGFTDAGQVNVTDRINESNQRLSNQNGGGVGVTNSDGTVTVPVQNTPQAQEAVPASMLRGSGVGSRNLETPPTLPPEEVASSTDSGEGIETASSTDSGELEIAPVVTDSETEADTVSE